MTISRPAARRWRIASGVVSLMRSATVTMPQSTPSTASSIAVAASPSTYSEFGSPAAGWSGMSWKYEGLAFITDCNHFSFM